MIPHPYRTAMHCLMVWSSRDCHGHVSLSGGRTSVDSRLPQQDLPLAMSLEKHTSDQADYTDVVGDRLTESA